MMQDSSPSGIRTFVIIWSGQVFSLLGSGLTAFALGVWVFQTTGSATRFALLTFSASLPGILMSPFAGVLVDRWDRRWSMILSDCVAGLTTALLIVLVGFDELRVWHLYGIIAINAAFSGLQQPAFSASVPLLVPKRHLGRAAGLAQAGVAGTRLLAPALAGALLAAIRLRGILFIDLATMSFAIATLLVVRIPRPPMTEAGSSSRGSFLQETLFGWTYIRKRRGLLALLILFAGTNFSTGMMFVLLTPLVLSFGSAKELGIVMSIGAGGFLTGSVVMSVWGGPKRRVNGIFCFLGMQAAILLLGGVRPSVPLVASAAFIYMFITPLTNGSSQVIWQSKVATDVMGRVFAIRRLVAASTLPLAYLLAGPLADFVFEPMLAVDGRLAGTVGTVIGVGPGRGIGLLYILLAFLIMLALALGYRSRSLRGVEKDLPDAIAGEAGAESGG